MSLIKKEYIKHSPGHIHTTRKNRLTRDHIVWAYRLFLEREAESENAIQEGLYYLHSIA